MISRYKIIVNQVVFITKTNGLTVKHHKTKYLIDKLAKIEAAMSSDWRRFGRYNDEYVILKCQIETELAAIARKTRVMAYAKAQKAFRLFQNLTSRLSARLRWFDYIRSLKNERPILWDWGVENSAVIED